MNHDLHKKFLNCIDVHFINFVNFNLVAIQHSSPYWGSYPSDSTAWTVYTPVYFVWPGKYQQPFIVLWDTWQRLADSIKKIFTCSLIKTTEVKLYKDVLCVKV